MKITKTKSYHKDKYWILTAYNSEVGDSTWCDIDERWKTKLTIPLEDGSYWRGEATDGSIKKCLNALLEQLEKADSKPDINKLSDTRPELERIRERNRDRVGMSDLIGHPVMGRVKVGSYIPMPKDRLDIQD